MRRICNYKLWKINQCHPVFTAFATGASINNAIAAAISEVTTDLSRRYEQKILAKLTDNKLNLKLVSSALDTESKIMSKFLKQYASAPKANANYTEPTVFARQMEASFWKPLEFLLPTKLTAFLEKQELDLQCLEKSSIFRQERLVGNWSEPLFKFQELHSTFNEWLKFCLQLESYVNSYAFQKNKPNWPTKDDWGPLGWLVYFEKYDIFKVNERIKQVARNMAKMGKQGWNVINAVMLFAYEAPRTSCVSQPRALRIQGNFVLLSNYAPNLAELAVAKCGAATTQVYILAGHTIFLDADITLKQLDLSILAPNWVDARNSQWNVLLKGQDAKSHSASSAPNGEAGLREQAQKGGKGQDGCPGRPGEPGGAFFGVAVSVASSNKLRITSQGGCGGSGQAGGNGGSGSSRNAKFPKPTIVEDKPDYIKRWFKPFQGYNHIPAKHYGVVGAAGGDGGNGGAKGIGGAPAAMSVIQFQTISVLVDYASINGCSLAAGPGGSGGPGGAAGLGYDCDGYEYMPSRVLTWDCKHVAPSNGRGPGPIGKSGISGVSTKICADADPPKSPRKIEEWRSLVDYKLAFYSKTHPSTVEFIRVSDTSPKTRNLFTLKALAGESLALEKVDRATSDPSRLSDMYFSLIRKLEQHSKTPGLSTEHQKVVGLLLVLSYSSVMCVRGPLGVGVVLDVSGYFKTVEEQIEKLKSATAVVKIQDERKNFGDSTQKKIGQAISFIRNVVTPAMFQASVVVEEKLKLLEHQLVTLIKDLKLNLEQCRNELRRAEAAQPLLVFTRILGVITDLAGAVSEFVPGAGTIAATLGSAVKKFEESLAKEGDLERLKELQKEAERIVEDFEDRRKNFHAEFAPMIKSILKYFVTVSEALKKGTKVIAPQLSVTKWEAMRKLKDAKIALEELSGDSLNEKPLVHAFDRMQDAITLIIDLYEMIDRYLDTQSLAGYIANVNAAVLNPRPLSDPELDQSVANIHMKLKQNLVEHEAGKAMHAFKQWVFPFAKYYIYPLQSAQASSGLGSAQLEQIEQLRQNLDKYNSMSVSGQDTFIIQTNFSSGIRTSQPFFTWKNEQFAWEIEALLSGSPVHLNADVRQQGMPGRDAIKFNLIEIHLKLNAPSWRPFLQREFDEVIQYFGVSMTHSGVSYYRFQNDYYSMTGENQTLTFNFERKPNGERVGRNTAYIKFEKGDYILSPYTVWTLQLTNEVPVGKVGGKRVDFSNLKKFAPHVDIELVGSGTYVNSVAAVEKAGGDLELDKYYQREDRLRLPQFKF